MNRLKAIVQFLDLAEENPINTNTEHAEALARANNVLQFAISPTGLRKPVDLNDDAEATALVKSIVTDLRIWCRHYGLDWPSQGRISRVEDGPPTKGTP